MAFAFLRFAFRLSPYCPDLSSHTLTLGLETLNAIEALKHGSAHYGFERDWIRANPQEYDCSAHYGLSGNLSVILRLHLVASV